MSATPRVWVALTPREIRALLAADPQPLPWTERAAHQRAVAVLQDGLARPVNRLGAGQVSGG